MRWLQRILDRSTPIREYRDDAQAWDTCEVGEVVKDFPDVVLIAPHNLDKREPADPRLRKLGLDFSRAVSGNDRKAALKIYDLIQARVRTLIRKKKHVA